jgi:hypothetical protein
VSTRDPARLPSQRRRPRRTVSGPPNPAVPT